MILNETHHRSKQFAFDMANIGGLELENVVYKSLSVRTEMLKRDLTKRQVNIIHFIYALSYIKDYAIIPKLQDFELCGISKTLIKKELEKLININVITWKKEENYFRLNEISEWNAPYHYGYNSVRAGELFEMNVKLVDFDNKKLVEE
jgi:hypothetical protein